MLRYSKDMFINSIANPKSSPPWNIVKTKLGYSKDLLINNSANPNSSQSLKHCEKQLLKALKQGCLLLWSFNTGRELSQITFAFFGHFWPHTYPSLHSYCSKCSILLTTYPPRYPSVICEGSHMKLQPSEIADVMYECPPHIASVDGISQTQRIPLLGMLWPQMKFLEAFDGISY